VLLDPIDRVLLLRFADPASGARLWVTPGGALEPGESHERAALRELAEETGLRDVTLGPCIGEHEHRFRWNGQAYAQTDRFFAARIRDLPTLSTPGLEAGEVLIEARWWSGDELAARAEDVSPPDLPARLVLAATAAPRSES
jgi:8-oxo-dGTP pyrophosphatase MutT (NUDIX family)